VPENAAYRTRLPTGGAYLIPLIDPLLGHDIGCRSPKPVSGLTVAEPVLLKDSDGRVGEPMAFTSSHRV
jgi:hypothetical protein